MIVVRRRDVEPGGRYAGGRFAPVIASEIPDPEPQISPRAQREETYQNIQDTGYLRARRITDQESASAQATVDTFDALAGELQPVLARFVAEEWGAARASPKSDVAGLADLLPVLGLNSAFEPDPRSIPGAAVARGRGSESLIRVAGGSGKIVELLLKTLLKQRVKPKPPKLPAPKRPDRDRPAPIAPPRPDRPLNRMPDEVAEPLRDGLHKDLPSEGSLAQERIRKAIRDAVEAKFRQTREDKIVLELEEIGAGTEPRQVVRQFVRLLERGEFAEFGPLDSKVQLKLIDVSPDLVHEIRSRTKIDLSGYQHSIDTQGLKHALRRHGFGNEKRTDQLPIDAESVSRFIDVVSDPANIYEVDQRRNGSFSITYRKRINGYVYFVEQIRKRGKILAFKTHYLKKGQ